ncbi:MAG: DNA polymerase I [Acidobacteriota bacterium]
MATLYLIDGSSQMYRAYHAIRGLTGPDGRATNAVFGFVMMLRRLLADHRPDSVAAAFDLPGPTFRTELAADYKAHRPPMPADLEAQIPWIHRSCEALGVPVLVSEGFEADDVIGTLALKGAAAGFDVAIVTGDKDFFQLVGGPVRVFNPRDDGIWYDEAGVVEKFGVLPRQVIDVLSLTGDAVDNVKGVPGIGEKGARELLAQFGSLDALLDQAASVTQKRYREALLAHPDAARLSRELVTINTAVPIEASLERYRYQGADRDACYELFAELGFKTLTREFAPPIAAATVVHDSQVVDSIVALDGPVPDGIVRDYQVVDSMAALEGLVRDAQTAGRFGLRVVGDDAEPMRARLVGIAISVRDGHARYIPLGHRSLDEYPNMPEGAVIAALRPLFEDETLAVAGHDVKTDMILLARHGATLRCRVFDTMLASYLLDSTRAPHAFETIALEHLGITVATEELAYGKGAKATPAAVMPAAATLAFAGERAALPLQVAAALQAQLTANGLADVNDNMELPLLSILADIEQAGVRIDTAVLAELSTRLERDLQTLSGRIFDLSGGPFNINSPKQLAEVLFDRLQLAPSRKTGKTRVASTAVDVLEELALTHELPRLVLDWRSMQKLKGTYIDALPQLVHADTGRVHTSFNQAVAATGRLSSSDPNLQNIPVRTGLGREIRRSFAADPGWVLISADYSQIELRVLAHLAGDEALIEAFRRGEDIHDRTADAIFGADSTRDRKERRTVAKMINYALLYGKTAFTLARDIGVTQQAAQAFIDAYFAGFPGVRGFLDRTLEDARISGVVSTLFGRRRPVPDLTSSNRQVRAATERIAVNMPIQGTAADIMKRAMIDVARALDARSPGPDRRRARMILTVHDELVFEVPRAEADEIAALVKTLMESAATLAVPLTVDVGIGDNWDAAKP